MSDLTALRELTLQMYSHTRAAQDARRTTILAASDTFVRKAPVKRLAPAESTAQMDAIKRAIATDLLNSPSTREWVKEGLTTWEGVRVS